VPPKRIYWITSEKNASGYPPETPVFENLLARGIKVVPTVWDRAPLPPLDPGDHVIVRNPWDYTEKITQFRDWLAALPSARVHNSAAILRWNLDKNYLRELEISGIQIVPTVWMNAKTEGEVSAIVRKSFPDRRKIVKPVFSAGSHHTYRLDVSELPPAGVFAGLSAIVQPYLEEIETDGERSLVFLGGNFSHAIRKLPRSGDFRVQESFGGQFSAFKPTREELRFGERAVATIRGKFPTDPAPLYGRIDYVVVGGNPHLMEAELLEPDLYFHHALGAAERFAALIAELSD
jgi:glutathione synthase/RimK-type ligase-like ATP-grasp enzyme